MRTRNPNPLCLNTGERRTKSIFDEASRRRRRTPQGLSLSVSLNLSLSHSLFLSFRTEP
ncbi:hypothetical protein RHMOL_Rhmol01G0056400 [Rhododendron molle]|uniref:Uncharacterized protein n=1 Tax=Rhododendron molle TaxID=49168 RepID=A0ACC0Q1N3_RHOML|nr:hypothetical protein RHMOL_Rhmol01G0056400 [Rhododendron molle]